MNDKSEMRLRRLIAALVDGLFIYIFFFAFSFQSALSLYNALKANTDIFSSAIGLVISILSAVVLSILYLVVPAIVFKGSTIGMKMVSIRFVQLNNENITLSKLIVRETLVIFTLILTCTLSVIASFVALFYNQDGKTFYDYISFNKVVLSR